MQSSAGKGGCEPGLECRLSFLCPVFQYRTIKVIFGSFSSKTPDVFCIVRRKKAAICIVKNFHKLICNSKIGSHLNVIRRS